MKSILSYNIKLRLIFNLKINIKGGRKDDAFRIDERGRRGGCC